MDNKYLIHESTFGYYKGSSEKYGDMIEFGMKEFAKQFSSYNEAEEVSEKFNKRGYDMNVVSQETE